MHPLIPPSTYTHLDLLNKLLDPEVNNECGVKLIGVAPSTYGDIIEIYIHTYTIIRDLYDSAASPGMSTAGLDRTLTRGRAM